LREPPAARVEHLGCVEEFALRFGNGEEPSGREKPCLVAHRHRVAGRGLRGETILGEERAKGEYRECHAPFERASRRSANHLRRSIDHLVHTLPTHRGEEHRDGDDLHHSYSPLAHRLPLSRRALQEIIDGENAEDDDERAA
jgi:hypothetical protein